MPGARERDRLRADSLDSSGLSSERFDSDQGAVSALEGARLGWGGAGHVDGRAPDWLLLAEDLEVDVESLVFGTETELLQSFTSGQEHSYSHGTGTWL